MENFQEIDYEGNDFIIIEDFFDSSINDNSCSTDIENSCSSDTNIDNSCLINENASFCEVLENASYCEEIYQDTNDDDSSTQFDVWKTMLKREIVIEKYLKYFEIVDKFYEPENSSKRKKNSNEETSEMQLKFKLKCKQCNKILIQTGGNTFVMRRHLEKLHQIKLDGLNHESTTQKKEKNAKKN